MFYHDVLCFTLKNLQFPPGVKKSYVWLSPRASQALEPPLLSSTVCLQYTLMWLPYLCLGLFPSAFQPKFCVNFPSPSCTTCTVRVILLSVIILIIFGEGYKLWSSSICSFLLPPVISSLLCPNILQGTAFSDTRTLEKNFHTHTKLYYSYVLIFTFLD